MSLGLVGRKVGMTRVFTDDGESLAVTVLDVAGNRVSQIKKPETDGYTAVQVAYGKRRASRVTKPMAGHFAKAGVEAGSILREFRVAEDALGELAPGGKLNIFAGIYPKDEIHVDPNLIHYGEFSLTGSADSTQADMLRALAFIENGQVRTADLVSHVLPLEALGQGLELVKNRVGLKVVVEVGGGQA
jgi:threonine dehydrogenase-like Zn-dependent dehydrogenase